MDLKLDVNERNGIGIVEVEGEIDVYTAPRLREFIIDLINAGHYYLIINLQRVEFLDSTGLGVLVGGLKRIRAHDGSMDLVCSQERILKIFKITGLNKVFGIHGTLEGAVQATLSDRAASGKISDEAWRIPIQIFLTDAEPAQGVEEALRTFLGELGAVVVDDGPPVSGSWYKRLTGQFKRAAGSGTAVKAQRAVEMQILDRFQAGIDGVTGDAVAKLITALDNTKGAVLQVGSVLLVKVEDTIVVRQLTQLEMAHWQQNPGLFRDPAQALMELQRAAEHSASGAPATEGFPRSERL